MQQWDSLPITPWNVNKTAHSLPDALSGTAGAAHTLPAADKLQQLNPATSYKPSIPCPIQESSTSLASLSEGT